MTNRISSIENAVVSTFFPALTVIIVLFIPFNYHTLVGIDLHSPHLPPLHGNAVIGILDFVSLLLIAACFVSFQHRRELRPLGIVLMGTGVLAIVSLIGLALSPSPNGMMLTFRLIGMSAIVYATRLMGASQFDRYVVTAIKFTISSQAIWALWQSFSGTRTAMSINATWDAGTGSFSGPYEMAAFLILGMTVVAWSSRLHPLRAWDYAAIGLSSAAIATTFGRTGVVTVLFIAGTYGVAWVRSRSVEMAWIAGFSALPMLIVGVALHTRWTQRASIPLGDLDSGRLDLIYQAILVIREHPVFGVGPGQYGPAIADLPPDVINSTMVHGVPLLVAAEFGIVVGLAFLIWLIALGLRSLRTSIHSIAIFGAAFSYLFLDNLHYVYPMGVAMLGFWLATLDNDRFMPTHRSDGLKRFLETENASKRDRGAT